MLIKGYENAFKVGHSIGRRLVGDYFPGQYKFSVSIGEFGHDSRDNWYWIKFYSPRITRCSQNLLEQEFCHANGFDFK